MRYFFKKIRSYFTKCFDAEIISEALVSSDNIPYFRVKMQGCQTPIEVKAEDIIEKFTNKFSQTDIKIATKIHMKYRNSIKLMMIEKKFAILYNNRNKTYQLFDLSDSKSLRNLDYDSLGIEDAFNLGVLFEKIRFQEDNNKLNVAKSKLRVPILKLVKNNEL